jgi:hypothetical protein
LATSRTARSDGSVSGDGIWPEMERSSSNQFPDLLWAGIRKRGYTDAWEAAVTTRAPVAYPDHGTSMQSGRSPGSRVVALCLSSRREASDIGGKAALRLQLRDSSGLAPDSLLASTSAENRHGRTVTGRNLSAFIAESIRRWECLWARHCSDNNAGSGPPATGCRGGSFSGQPAAVSSASPQ